MIYASDSNGATSESAATGADDSLAVDPSHSESEEQEALEPEASSPYPGVGAPTISVQQEQDAGDATPLAAAVEKERMRSDSEGSFRSIDSREAMRAARPSHELTAPSSGGAASSIYEDLPPLPSTPYFDASPTLSQKEREGEKTIDGLRTPLASRFPSSASPSARSPPMPSSDSGPTTRSSMTLPRIERQEAMALPAQPKSARPFGEEDEVVASGVAALSPESSSMWRSSSPLGTGSTRQRATTLSSAAGGKRRSQATDYGSAASAALDAAAAAASASSTSSSQQALSRKSTAGTSSVADPMARQASKDSTFTPNTGGGGGNSSTDAESISSVRKRAISQPGRRPIIPSSFQAPALPKFSRKMSIPSLSSAFGAGGGGGDKQHQASSSLSPSTANNLQGQQQREQQQREQRPGPSGTAAYRFPSPAPSFTSGYHALLDSGAANSPAVVPGEYPWSSAASTSGVTPGGSVKPRTAPTTTTTMSAAPPSDLFPAGLASHHIHGTVSFNLNQPSRAPRRLLACLPSSLHPDPNSYDVAPTPSAQVVLRPFVTARSVRNSLATGAFLTRKLCVLPSSWHYAVAGAVRLASLEAKVRAIEAVCSGIDAVDKSGQPLLLLANSTSTQQQQQTQGMAATQASHFAKQLEDFDLLCGEVQNALAKKINFIESTGEAAASAAAAAAAASSQSLLPSSNGSASGGGSGGTMGKKSAFQNKFFTRSFLVDRVHAAAGKAGGSAGSGSSSVNGGGSNGSAFAHGASASLSGSTISAAGSSGGGDSSAMAFIDGVARLLGKVQVLEAHLEACLAPLAPKAAAVGSPANGNGDAAAGEAHKDAPTSASSSSHLPVVVTMYNATRRGSASDSVLPTSSTSTATPPTNLSSSSPTDSTTAGPPIPLLPQELRRLIEAKLRRSSDFLANVVLRFVLRDLGLLVDKAVKRSAGGGGLVEG